MFNSVLFTDTYRIHRNSVQSHPAAHSLRKRKWKKMRRKECKAIRWWQVNSRWISLNYMVYITKCRCITFCTILWLIPPWKMCMRYLMDFKVHNINVDICCLSILRETFKGDSYNRIEMMNYCKFWMYCTLWFVIYG